MKSILLVFLITLPNLLGITHLNKKTDLLISTREELKTAVYNAKNNDVILVDNIDFTSGISGLYNLFERIDIKKSITIKGKEGKVISSDPLQGKYKVLIDNEVIEVDKNDSKK